MVKTFGQQQHPMDVFVEQEDNIKRQRHGVEYLKYVDTKQIPRTMRGTD